MACTEDAQGQAIHRHSAVLTLANGVFNLAQSGVLPLSPLTATRIAPYLVVIIVTVKGGRVIPSFTANARRVATPAIPSSPGVWRWRFTC